MTTQHKAERLIKLLTEQKPASDAEARACVETATALATELGIKVSIRKEGSPFPEGFFKYPIEDACNIGAVVKCGRKSFGWRWSVKIQMYHDWTSR